MKEIISRFENNKGATSVVVALIVIVLLITTSFVSDFGIAYVKIAQIQNAADSSALAAASELPIAVGNTSAISKARNTAIEYANKNDYIIKAEDISFIQNSYGYYTEVSVNVKKDVNLLIAPIIGINSVKADKQAVARVAPTSTATHMVPVSITKSILDEAKLTGNTNHLELKISSPGNQVEKGAFGAIEIDGKKGGGANDYREYLMNGYPGKLHIGDILPVKTGNMSGPTLQGFFERYNQCNHYASAGGCNIEHFVEDCPRIVIVPVVTYKSKHTVIINGFAVFLLEDCPGPGNRNTIIGSFISDVQVSGTASDADDIGGENDFGVYSIYLVK